MDLIYLAAGLVLLIGAGDALVRGAVSLSLRAGLPVFIISATVVAFGTSAPELLISVQAALEGSPGLALGNVVGSNIANVLLVLGVPAVITPLAGCGQGARRNLWFMIAATVLFLGLTLSGVVTLWGGLVLLVFVALMVGDSIRSGMQARGSAEEEAAQAELEELEPHMPPWKTALLLGAGLMGLPLGAHLLIEGARGIALAMGVSEAVIGLTVVAIGTSLPELATTVMAAMRRQTDVAMGNVIGSNIFNLTAIIGAAALFAPLPVPPEIMGRDIWVMAASSALMIPFVLWCLPIGRPVGALFCVLYAVYVGVAVL